MSNFSMTLQNNMMQMHRLFKINFIVIAQRKQLPKPRWSHHMSGGNSGKTCRKIKSCPFCLDHHFKRIGRVR